MISGKMLRERGWPQGRAIGRAKDAAARLETDGWEREAILGRLDEVLSDPAAYLDDEVLGAAARELYGLRRQAEEAAAVPVLHPAPLPYGVWGAEQIDAGAIAQMDGAMRLPISVAGALMLWRGLPDGSPCGSRRCARLRPVDASRPRRSRPA